jgi:hypothetical protein
VLWEGLNLPALHWEQLLLAEVAANVPPAQVVQEEACVREESRVGDGRVKYKLFFGLQDVPAPR